MTEREWLNKAAHPQFLVRSFTGTSITRTKVGRRKLRLFACGCCRAIWPHIPDARLRNAVEVAEQFADGRATADQLAAARTAADILRGPRGFSERDPNARANTVVALVRSTTEPKPSSAAFGMTVYPLPLANYRGTPAVANALICDLLRDVFGNPFKNVPFDKRWRTETAVLLASTMYESREFGAMPILADALQDAGCDNTDILNHCRDANQTHVRGCFVLDHILGKG